MKKYNRFVPPGERSDGALKAAVLELVDFFQGLADGQAKLTTAVQTLTEILSKHETLSKRESARSKRDPLELLTPDEAAVILKVKRIRVLEMSRLGKFPRVKIGKFVRFRRADVEAQR